MTGGGAEIERLIELMAKLPGLGPRSARRAVLALVRRREALLVPLAQAMAEVGERVTTCRLCGNLATEPECAICRDPRRDASAICVVEDVGDLWALERAGVFRGRYHVLGGLLSALDGVTPAMLRIPDLAQRARTEGVREVILALAATMDAQTTAHVIAEYLEGTGVEVFSLGQGVPVGGELDYLDDGTLSAALAGRKRM
ncbi:MAG TPA: recombination mediator RecR [Thermohalobaculum sp.]|nr:recombination mediator RecR [Thermohalobaculum sp.]